MKFDPVNITIFSIFTLLPSLADFKLLKYKSDKQIEIISGERQEGTRRILGGTAVPSDKYSFVVALLRQNKSEHCTGSIIAPMFVLTAAHCSFFGPYHVYKALENNKSKQCKYYKIDEFISHPAFEMKFKKIGNTTNEMAEMLNDIALVQTSENMIHGWVTQIPLSYLSIADVEHQLATAIGFGFIDMFKLPGLDNVQQVELELIGCDFVGLGILNLTNIISSVTPKNKPPRGLCGGDSGGPLVYKGKLHKKSFLLFN